MKTTIKKATLYAFSLLLGFGLLPACQSNINYPAVDMSSSESVQPGAFVWRDLVTRDPAAAQQFYGEMFGWTFETIGTETQQYTVIRHDGKAIGGIIRMPVVVDPASTAEWVSSMTVPSVKGAAEIIKSKGGKIIFPVSNLKGRGMSAVVSDPQGAIIGLVEGGTPDDDPPLNTWLWTELWSGQPTQSAEFYRSFVNYEVKKMDNMSPDYWIFENGDTKSAGLLKNPMENTRSQWLPYIRVADPAALTQKARDAGATVLAAPSSELRDGNVAVLLDPTGAPFVIQRWPLQ